MLVTAGVREPGETKNTKQEQQESRMHFCNAQERSWAPCSPQGSPHTQRSCKEQQVSPGSLAELCRARCAWFINGMTHVGIAFEQQQGDV